METPEYDVLCVGAGPVGAWFAWKMAAKGYKVIAIEARSYEKVGRRFNPIHMDKLAFSEQDIPLPEVEAPIFGGSDREDARRLMKEQGPMIRQACPVDWDAPTAPEIMEEKEYIAHYTTSRFWGSNHDKAHVLELDICSLSFPLFNKRLHGLATDAGVEILYETEFHEFLTCTDESGKSFVEGIIAKNKKSGEENPIRAKITVDCSGWRSVARQELPPEIANEALMEREKIQQQELYTTYMQQWRTDYALPAGLNTFTDFKGFVIQISPNEWTLGIGAPIPAREIRDLHLRMVQAHLGEPVDRGSLEQTEKEGEEARARFAEKGGGLYDGNEAPLNFERQITAEHLEYVPVGRCSLKTLVANGFAVVGDAGYQNKPYNGEGMESGMWAAGILIEVLDDIFQADVDGEKLIPDKERLWAYNLRYFRGIGAKLAEFNSSGRALARMSDEDFDFFATRFITEGNMQELFTRHELTLSLKMILKAMRLFVLRPGLMVKVLNKLAIARSIKKAHLKYPDSFNGYEDWFRRFQGLNRKLMD